MIDRTALTDRRLPHDRTTQMSDESTTVHAADLAERILDEVSEAEQDWRTIERCARELYELAAARVAKPATAPLSGDPDR
jgi:hypothetical protein